MDADACHIPYEYSQVWFTDYILDLCTPFHNIGQLKMCIKHTCIGSIEPEQLSIIFFALKTQPTFIHPLASAWFASFFFYSKLYNIAHPLLYDFYWFLGFLLLVYRFWFCFFFFFFQPILLDFLFSKNRNPRFIFRWPYERNVHKIICCRYKKCSGFSSTNGWMMSRCANRFFFLVSRWKSIAIVIWANKTIPGWMKRCFNRRGQLSDSLDAVRGYQWIRLSIDMCIQGLPTNKKKKTFDKSIVQV